MTLKVLDMTDITQKTESFRQGLHTGMFYLKIPEPMQRLITHGMQFAREFYQDTNLKQLTLSNYSGYFDRENCQAESFVCERIYWDTYFKPSELRDLAHQMSHIATEVLLAAMEISEIPKKLWPDVTGKLCNDHGQNHMTFNHYCPEKSKKDGLREHRDFGAISVLYMEQKGLEAKINGSYQPILAKPNCFVIQCGRALETLINNTRTLNALFHKVTHQDQDRFSFVAFLCPDNDSPVYQWKEEKPVKVHETYKEFCTACYKELFSS